MDAQARTRSVQRDDPQPASQLRREQRQVVIPMTRSEYDELWTAFGRCELSWALIEDGRPFARCRGVQRKFQCPADTTGLHVVSGKGDHNYRQNFSICISASLLLVQAFSAAILRGSSSVMIGVLRSVPTQLPIEPGVG